MGCLVCQGDSIYTIYTGSDQGKYLISQENDLKKGITTQSLRGEGRGKGEDHGRRVSIY